MSWFLFFLPYAYIDLLSFFFFFLQQWAYTYVLFYNMHLKMKQELFKYLSTSQHISDNTEPWYLLNDISSLI